MIMATIGGNNFSLNHNDYGRKGTLVQDGPRADRKIDGVKWVATINGPK